MGQLNPYIHFSIFKTANLLRIKRAKNESCLFQFESTKEVTRATQTLRRFGVASETLCAVVAVVVVVGQLKSSLVNHHFSLTDAGNLSTAPPSFLFRKQEIDVFILFLIYLLKGEIRYRTKSVNGFPRYLDILPYLVSFMGVSRSNGIYQQLPFTLLSFASFTCIKLRHLMNSEQKLPYLVVVDFRVGLTSLTLPPGSPSQVTA